MSRHDHASLARARVHEAITIHLCLKRCSVLRCNEIDKSVTQICSELDVPRQVEEVISRAKPLFVNLCHYLFLTLPAWNVLQHHCRDGLNLIPMVISGLAILLDIVRALRPSSAERHAVATFGLSTTATTSTAISSSTATPWHWEGGRDIDTFRHPRTVSTQWLEIMPRRHRKITLGATATWVGWSARRRRISQRPHCTILSLHGRRAVLRSLMLCLIEASSGRLRPRRCGSHCQRILAPSSGGRPHRTSRERPSVRDNRSHRTGTTSDSAARRIRHPILCIR
mmetsp:Transcript_25751/g.47252  ORF Transcript_25751/g.47252 Transcript_25751/m.47252 type:complete len:283 (+) Transcript_25751:217-1065(+)